MIKADNTQKRCFVACDEQTKKDGRCSCLTNTHQSLQLLQPDVIKSVCSDENLQCTDYKTACEKCLNAFYEYKKQTVL